MLARVGVAGDMVRGVMGGGGGVGGDVAAWGDRWGRAASDVVGD